MFELIGKGIDGTIFYQKKWTKEPSRKTINLLKDRYDNKYGAYLAWSFNKPEELK